MAAAWLTEEEATAVAAVANDSGEGGVASAGEIRVRVSVRARVADRVRWQRLL